MSSFNPYHSWLGIPSVEQPANHYRLLGISDFENDPKVIERAASSQIALVKQHALGKQEALANQLIDELSRAQIVLLNEQKRKEYDSQLQKDLKPTNPDPSQGFKKQEVEWSQELVASLTAENKSLLEKLAKSNEKLALAHALINKRVEELNKHEKKIESLQQVATAATSKASDVSAKLDAQQNTDKELKKNVEALTKKVAVAERKAMENESSVKTITAERDELSQKIAQLESRKAEAEEKLQTQLDDMSKIQSERSTAQKLNKQFLDSNRLKNDELEKRTEELESAKSKIADISSENQSLKKEIESLKREMKQQELALPIEPLEEEILKTQANSLEMDQFSFDPNVVSILDDEIESPFPPREGMESSFGPAVIDLLGHTDNLPEITKPPSDMPPQESDGTPDKKLRSIVVEILDRKSRRCLESFTLDVGGSLKFGRHPDFCEPKKVAEILQQDRRLSSKHLTIVLEPGQVIITDVGSKNGTLLRGKGLKGSSTIPATEVSPSIEVVAGDKFLFKVTPVWLPSDSVVTDSVFGKSEVAKPSSETQKADSDDFEDWSESKF